MGSSFYKPRIKDNGDESLEWQINRNAKRMAKARDKGDDERFLFLKERVSVQCFRYFCIEGPNEFRGIDEELTSVLAKLLEEYDPGRAQFTHAVRGMYTMRRRGAAEKASKLAERELSFDECYEGDSLQNEKCWDNVGGSYRAADDSDEKEAAILLSLLALITRFVEGKDDKRFEARKKYTRLFFTETVVRIVKEQTTSYDCMPLCRCESAVFKTMSLPFLDEIMAALCRRILEIWETALSPGVPKWDKAQMIYDGVVAYSPWTLPASFYKSYLLENEGVTVSDAAISQQRKKYRELISQISSADPVDPAAAEEVE